MPRWSRWPLRLPYLPLTEAAVVRPAGDIVVRAARWVLTPQPEAATAEPGAAPRRLPPPLRAAR